MRRKKKLPPGEQAANDLKDLSENAGTLVEQAQQKIMQCNQEIDSLKKRVKRLRREKFQAEGVIINMDGIIKDLNPLSENLYSHFHGGTKKEVPSKPAGPSTGRNGSARR